MQRLVVAALVFILFVALAPSVSPTRTILAIGAHPGDMEISCGAVLAKHVRQGDRVVLLHLTAGEGGNPKVSPEEYGQQKRREAAAAAKILGAEVVFGPYADGQLPDNDESRRFVADVIRQVRPTHVITHWKAGLHKDHIAAHFVTNDAVLLASLDGFKTEHPACRGVRGVYYTENWEDKEGFSPYLYVDVSDSMQSWEEAVKQYELIRGGISTFPYFDYYQSLARVRGAESGFRAAVAFDIDSFGKKRALPLLP